MKFNRYRRGLETCPQAETSKSGHAIFFSFFDASERRVWLSAESKILTSTFGRFRLYRLKLYQSLFHDFESNLKIMKLFWSLHKVPVWDTTALAILVTKVMASTVQISMSVLSELITVTNMRTVPIQTDHFSARATMVMKLSKMRLLD